MNPTTPALAAILDTLRQVEDPEIGCNIVDLGLVYSVTGHDGRVKVTMGLTTPGCPMAEGIAQGVRQAVLSLEGVTEVQVELVWDPPWHPSLMTEAGRALTGVNNN